MKFYYEVPFVKALSLLALTTRCFTSKEAGISYGEEWIYFFDDYKKISELNLSTIFEETHDMILGDTYFYLYTRENEYTAEELLIPEGNNTIDSLYFNKSNDIRVVTHGWRGAASAAWVQNIKHSFLREFDLNVITVDWYELSRTEIYPLAAISTRYVGSRLAKLLDALVLTPRTTNQSIHLIGHSLGAHVMGYAGMLSTEKIFRITGLDPARPLFEIPAMPPDFRLDKSDAEFVDIIHTCGGVYGYRASCGHADFYPNNGYPMQPGCDGARQAVDACSHSRSHEYFVESIEYTSESGFIAYDCESWEKFERDECKNNPTSSMGYPARVTSRGDFYLRTKNESKYAI